MLWCYSRVKLFPFNVLKCYLNISVILKIRTDCKLLNSNISNWLSPTIIISCDLFIIYWYTLVKCFANLMINNLKMMEVVKLISHLHFNESPHPIISDNIKVEVLHKPVISTYVTALKTSDIILAWHYVILYEFRVTAFRRHFWRAYRPTSHPTVRYFFLGNLEPVSRRTNKSFSF